MAKTESKSVTLRNYKPETSIYCGETLTKILAEL